MKENAIFKSDGIVLLNKSKGISSFKAINKLKWIIKSNKVGHAGTLDPIAEGLLIVMVNNATKFSDNLMKRDKEYFIELKLGYETATYDTEGEITEKYEGEINISDEKIFEAIRSFTGEIMQVPPMYSAIKINGEKLYELARKGIEVERQKREAEIYSLIILNFYDNKIRFEVNCSKGTYIRSLFNDIASDTDNFAYMSSLCRSKYGIFKIENAFSLERLKNFNENQLYNSLMKIEDVFEYERIDFDKKYFKHISNGLRKTFDIEKEGIFKIYCDNIFIGIGELVSEESGKLLKMINIFYKSDSDD